MYGGLSLYAQGEGQCCYTLQNMCNFTVNNLAIIKMYGKQLLTAYEWDSTTYIVRSNFDGIVQM